MEIVFLWKELTKALKIVYLHTHRLSGFTDMGIRVDTPQTTLVVHSTWYPPLLSVYYILFIALGTGDTNKNKTSSLPLRTLPPRIEREGEEDRGKEREREKMAR